MRVERIRVGTCIPVAVLAMILFAAGAVAQTALSPGGTEARSEQRLPSEPVVRESGSAGVQTSVGETLAWREILKSGGWIMYVLGGMSMLTVALVIYFLIVLRAAQVAPRPLRGELLDKIRNGNIEDARKSCEYWKCPLSTVVLSALDYIRETSDTDGVLVKDVMEGEGGRQAEAIQGQTQYLLDIAVIAPMIGLLGTVFGMLRAFSSVALDIAQAKPVALAGGVSQALITTAGGLAVGIPAMVFFAFFRRRAAKLVSLLESASTEVLTSLLGRGRP